jgi:NADH:ubiquinone oxidoreductase subunit F (NADH-binding)
MTAATDVPLLPRLLVGVGDRPTSRLECHLDLHGTLPDLGRWAPEQVISMFEQAGIRGRGGASFPVAAKMRAVASRRWSKVVVANGSEGEPASKKDRALLREVPHLVLDGVAIAARAVGAREAVIAISEHDDRGARGVADALRERREARVRGEPRFDMFSVPERFISGQSSALANAISAGPGKPTFGPRPFERGVRNRPTLMQNVETLAHLALIARHGPGWFRQLGTLRDPGSTLVTLSGAIASPGVYEIEHGMPLADLLASAGFTDEPRAVLIGGYFGSWLPAAAIPGLSLAPERLADYGASLGCGVIVALGSAACPVAETARVADYFAAQSAGQCGPCVNGLAAIADTVQQLRTGTASRTAQRDLERWTTEIPRRGACQYPDGAVRFIASALRVFADEFQQHSRRGRCDRCAQIPTLPAPPARPAGIS